MKFYFLTQDIMDNTIKNALKTGAIIAGLATNPVLADETTNSKVATIVTINGDSIDFNSKITSIDKEIIQIQTKIDILLQKANLSEADQLRYLTLDNEIEKLTAEKLAIVDSMNQQKVEDKAISTEKNKEAHETIKALDEMKDFLAKK